MTRGSWIPENGLLGFHRLAVMGLNENGMQPFVQGRLHGCLQRRDLRLSQTARSSFRKQGYQFVSDSDCELLLPLYRKQWARLCLPLLDAEFALILYDAKTGIASSRPVTRSAFVPCITVMTSEGAIVFASEPKNLVGHLRTDHAFSRRPLLCAREAFTVTVT